jgi:putative phage-type endonuclease
MIQGDAEWIAARLGRVTASRVADVVARTKSGFSSSRANYMAELICERLTGQPAEKFTNGPMQWGVEKEAEARDAYVWKRDREVIQVGFIPHPTIGMSGASPDGLISNVGMVEIKCPLSSTHIDTLLSGAVPAKYITQIQWQIACCERNWCDFVSYDPRLPPAMQLFVTSIWRDDAMIADLEKHVVAFLEELDAKLCALRSAYDLNAVLKQAAFDRETEEWLNDPPVGQEMI